MDMNQLDSDEQGCKMIDLLGREACSKTSSTKENQAEQLTHQMAEKEINKNSSEVMTEKDYRSQRTDITMLTHKEITGIGQHGTKTTKGELIKMIKEGMTRLTLKRCLRRSGHKVLTKHSYLIKRQLRQDSYETRTTEI